MSRSGFFRSPKKSNLPSNESLQNISIAVYILQLISIFTGGLFSLIPLTISILSRTKSQGLWIDNHFRWQIQTFWFSTPFFVLGWLFAIIPFLGWILSFFLFIFGASVIAVRTIRGWKRLTIQKSPQVFLD